LEGPCSYEVESTRGGYLSLGKLVARVGTGNEGRGTGEGAGGRQPLAAVSNPQSPIPNPLFAVRTPAALVTDLGTEFGVWVAENGHTTSQVFAGSVRLAVMGSQADGSNVEQVLHSGQICRVEQDRIKVVEPDENVGMQFVRELPEREELQEIQLVGRIDYSDTWTANTPDRSGGFVPLESPEALRVERCHGNPPRSWILSSPVAVTTWPGGARTGAWPGFTPRGSKSGFTELSGLHGVCYLGIEYGLRDDFTVQFDAVQTDDRINVTVGDEPATIEGARSLSVFFRAPGGPYPEIGVYNRLLGEADAKLSSGITAPFKWHNYAVRFNLREKRLSVWIDGRYRGAIELADVERGPAAEKQRAWAELSWTNQYVTIGGFTEQGMGRVWTDNFRIGSPANNDPKSNETTTLNKPE
ncbi:MAG: FecR domain-containing protein, partial [Pirellulaceae bacterium]|nr:FecR domain-containing protein [Pirellulaceae bacterium]